MSNPQPPKPKKVGGIDLGHLLSIARLFGIDVNHPWRLLFNLLSRVGSGQVVHVAADLAEHHMGADGRQRDGDALIAAGTALKAGDFAEFGNQAATLVGDIKP